MKKVSFDISLAKKGFDIETVDGIKVRIICYNRRNKDYPIVALLDEGRCENIEVYTKDGKYIIGENNTFDLKIIIPE